MNLLDQSPSGQELVTDALARLMSYIHNTNGHRQYCHVANTAQHCRLGLFQDSVFAGDLENSKINLGESYMYFRRSNIRSHQLDVQETNVNISQFHRISFHFAGCWFKNRLATCSRLVGRGDRSVTFIEGYRITNPWSSRRLLAKNHKSKPKQKGNQDVIQLSHVDHVPTSANSSQGESQLNIF